MRFGGREVNQRANRNFSKHAIIGQFVHPLLSESLVEILLCEATTKEA